MRKDFRKAFGNYNKAAELDPDNSEYLAKLGRFHLVLVVLEQNEMPLRPAAGGDEGGRVGRAALAYSGAGAGTPAGGNPVISRFTGATARKKPTGIKAGVSTVPRGKVKRPRRALPSVASSSNSSQRPKRAGSDQTASISGVE